MQIEWRGVSPIFISIWKRFMLLQWTKWNEWMNEWVTQFCPCPACWRNWTIGQQSRITKKVNGKMYLNCQLPWYNQVSCFRHLRILCPSNRTRGPATFKKCYVWLAQLDGRRIGKKPFIQRSSESAQKKGRPAHRSIKDCSYRSICGVWQRGCWIFIRYLCTCMIYFESRRHAHTHTHNSTKKEGRKEGLTWKVCNNI